MLTGRMPFTATEQVPLRVAHQSVPPPSVASFRAEVPAGAGDLVAAMLAKDPAARPSAETVYRTLLPLASAPDGAAVPGGDARRDLDGRSGSRCLASPSLVPRRRRRARRRARSPRTRPRGCGRTSRYSSTASILRKRSGCWRRAWRVPCLGRCLNCRCGTRSLPRCWSAGSTGGPGSSSRRPGTCSGVTRGCRP